MKIYLVPGPSRIYNEALNQIGYQQRLISYFVIDQRDRRSLELYRKTGIMGKNQKRGVEEK